jgi:DNA-binding response OmpR family regulator
VDSVAERRRALVIEDAADIRLLLCETLRQAGFDATGAGTGSQGLQIADRLQPDLVTLDLTLPDIDGIEVCRPLRTRTSAYLIMLTGRDEEADRLTGLEVGADDYMVKPFSPRELRARVAAMFRRPRLADAGTSEEPPVLRVGDLVLDQESRAVALGGEPVALTRIEFELLAAFMSKPRRVWERSILAQRIWDTNWSGDDHAVEVHVANLRRKLANIAHGGQWVQTVRGVGYRFGGPNDG